MTTAPSTKLLTDRAWLDVVAWLPKDTDALALETGALRKRREVRSGVQLLRLVLGYALTDLSLRSTAAWASAQGIAQLSDVALLKRLCAAPPFLEALLARQLSTRVALKPAAALPWRVRITDSTTVSHPGSTGADWRIHVGYDPVAARFDTIEVTDGRGGEHLGRVQPGPGELVVGDRGYAHPDRLVEARAAGAHVLVRVGHSAVPMWAEDGTRLDPVVFATRKRPKAGRPPRVEEVGIALQASSGARCDARLIIVRKSVEATEHDRARIRRDAVSRGKKVTARTLRAAAFTFLLTTVPTAEADATSLAELYRIRWQVELAFKRWKSLLNLAELRAKDPRLARTYVLGKLIAAVFADTLARSARAFSPWGVPL